MTCIRVFTTITSVVILSVIVSSSDVNFAVRTKQNRNNQYFEDSVDEAKINPRAPFKFMVHGWLDRGSNSWIQNLGNAYLDRGDYNIIAVNWQNLAQQAYPVSARIARQVGRTIANQIVRLNNKNNVALSNVQLIGHSLGGHVVGFAGKEVFRTTGKKLEWITGLDPAGPLFEVPLQNKNNRLSNEDARFVEIIHSDGGALGFRSPLGTSDFYPNGGTFIQPGCRYSLGTSVLCSHVLATKFYTDAVRQGGVAATKCNSWQVYQSGQCRGNQKIKYGAESPPKVKGNFYNAV